ncbi:MAG: DUF2254 domain-containing protein [Aquihabitans sp.]
MRLRLSMFGERLRSSLFFIPMVGVFLSVGLGALTLAIDRRISVEAYDLPLSVETTVDGARSLLGTIAGATISFAGIAFSVSLLIFQQASNQYSPRVVNTLFRDPFNKRVMGLVVGTFTYCVIILRSVRAPLESGGAEVVPNLSVVLAVILGVATILAVVAFIDHSAHTLDVSEILEKVRREAIEHIREEWREVDVDANHDELSMPEGPEAIVRFTKTGWVQQLDMDELVTGIPKGSTLQLQAQPGRYAIRGTVLGTVTPVPDDIEATTTALNGGVATGNTRTMQEDASYALRQLSDVTLKALSPSINDPTTAQDAIFHSAAVLAEMVHRDPPRPRLVVKDERRIILAQQPVHADLVRLVFEETRRAAANQPSVSVYLLEAIELLTEPLEGTPLADRATPLLEQARLVVAGSRAAGLLPADLAEVEQAYMKRFGRLPVDDTPAGG